MGYSSECGHLMVFLPSYVSFPCSFQDRAKDTLKISGMQVSPTEIEDTLLAHPDKLIVDAAVAGVSGGRTSDEKIPRAWVVLSETGIAKGEAVAVKSLDAWAKKSLSKYKRLRGGIEVVVEVCCACSCISASSLTFSLKTSIRYPNRPPERYCVEFYRMNTIRG